MGEVEQCTRVSSKSRTRVSLGDERVCGGRRICLVDVKDGVNGGKERMKTNL